MEVTLETLQSLLTTNNEKYLPGIINFCSEAKVFCCDNKEGQDVAAFINSLFSKIENRDVPLTVLQNFIPQCSRDVLNANILSWIQQCTKTLINTEDGSLSLISFKVLKELIRISTNFPEARKEIAISVIPKSLDHYVREAKSSKENVLVVLQCLEQTLDSYGKSCGIHKEEITTLVFSFLESTTQNVYTSAKCYLYLAASGSPGTNCENYANNWFIQEKFLLNVLNGLMDYLFENINLNQDIYRMYDLGDYRPKIPGVIDKSLLRRKQRLASQFRSVAEFLSVHLMGSFPAPKKILPESILNVIWRGLSVNCSTLMKISFSADVSNLLTVVSEINLSCLKLLNALIVSCRMNLVTYSPFVCRILSQILNWTKVQNWPYGIGKPHRAIRVEAYICATRWLTISNACSGINEYMDEMLASIISDVNIEPPSLTLKIPATKGKGRKHKQKRDAPITSADHIVTSNENGDTCKAALDLIPPMLSSVSTAMKPEQHKLLQEITVRKLLHIQHSGTSLAPVPMPYSNVDCRLSLYKALLSLCNNYHPSFPPPINFATVIFSKGMKDSSVKILTFCIHALSSIGKVLKPPFPSLEFPPVIEGLNCFINEKLNSNTQIERNQHKRNKSINARHFLNSTPVRDDCATSCSFLQNLDKSYISPSSETIDEKTDEPNQITALLEPELYKKTISARNEKDNKKPVKEVSGTSLTKHSEVHGVAKVVERELIVDNDSHTSCNSAIEDYERFITNQSCSSTMTTEKKRHLEEKDDVDTASSKKVKINGISEEHASIVEDSDDEMLNSFVDEVIDV